MLETFHISKANAHYMMLRGKLIKILQENTSMFCFYNAFPLKCTKHACTNRNMGQMLFSKGPSSHEPYEIVYL